MCVAVPDGARLQAGQEMPDQCSKVHAGNKVTLFCDFDTRILQFFVNGTRTGPDVVVGGDGPIYPCASFYGSVVGRIGVGGDVGACSAPCLDGRGAHCLVTCRVAGCAGCVCVCDWPRFRRHC